MSAIYKRPESVLIVVFTRECQVLVLNRINPTEFWQSVTGSLEWNESAESAAFRELQEETGLLIESNVLTHHSEMNCFPIAPAWRARYDPEVEYNIEHTFSVSFAEAPEISLSSKEHSEYQWLEKADAIQKVSSYTNKKSISDIVPD
ncbi:Dihydroneopterin triphosphate pyrophosphohydrolase type 2 [hydrothermal vent metagenome]|uniref:Dihydroneopterin triphosphate pyrophosphohydrolase type 2 n=1 Tax=hydrothermal vent metagenome TaxID=652676 RepID=A0A3B0XVB7_9ZZZZ